MTIPLIPGAIRYTRLKKLESRKLLHRIEEKSCQLYLWILKAGQIRVKVKFDPLSCTGQGHSTHQQHNQHHKWKSCCYVHHLDRTNELLAKIPFSTWLINLELQQQYFLFRFFNPYLSGGQKKNCSLNLYANRSVWLLLGESKAERIRAWSSFYTAWMLLIF